MERFRRHRPSIRTGSVRVAALWLSCLGLTGLLVPAQSAWAVGGQPVTAAATASATLTLGTPVQRCYLPCRLTFTATLRDKDGRPERGVRVTGKFVVPVPADAPNGGTAPIPIATSSVITDADGAARFSLSRSSMRAIQLEVTATDKSGIRLSSRPGAAFFIGPGAAGSATGMLVFAPGPHGDAYGICTATMIGSAYEGPSGSAFHIPGILATAGHCVLGNSSTGSQFWFYPASTHCNFSTVESTRVANQSVDCAPLGIWRGRSATAPANYLQRGWQAADVGFVRLDADPITGATIDELTPGVPLQFNTTTPQHGWDLYGYPLGENSQIRVNICPGIHLVHVVPVTSVAGADAGPGDDWTVPCSGMIGGASGGPWINVQTHRIEAINSKEQDGVVVGALLGDAAESAYRAQAFVQWPGTTTPAGGATADTLGNASSGGSHISADGRFITYRSNATNLVSGDTNDTDDVFVFDTQTLRTSRVSVANGDVQGDGMSDWPTISADGRYVAFRSAASNLVPGDTNGADDTFVRDLVAGTTTRVSVGTAEAQGNSSVRGGPTISADGHYVAFFSYASNLVPGDTNGMSDVFVRDRQTGRTSRVSVSSAGAQANPYDHIEDDARPSISADGRYVAFVSGAANLTPGDTNGTDDVFVRDRQTGRTTRASVSSAGAQTRAWSDWPSISGDGRYVAFVSAAADLVPGDVNRTDDIFVRDLHAGSTTRVSVSSAEVQSRGASSNPDISSDGRYVVFQSAGTNLVPADTNSRDDVFLRDRQAGTTSRISVTTTNGQVNGASSYPSIAPSGRYVVFSSLGTNLGPWDTNDTWDVFVRRLRA